MPTTRLPDVYVDEKLAAQVRQFTKSNELTYAELVRSTLARETDPEHVEFTRQRFVAEPPQYSFAGVRSKSPYSFDGAGYSYLRDVWADKFPNETSNGNVFEARTRLQRFQSFTREASAQFTTVTTANASQIVEPEYKPLLADWTQDRPLFAAASRSAIASPAPFTVPGTIADANVEAATTMPGTEATNPSDNAVPTFSGGTVVPVSVVGLYRCTREVIDSASPALDSVLLGVLRESYARQVEAKIYAELNGTGGQGGTITAGFVPSGAAVRTSTGAALPTDLRKAILAHTNNRGLRPRYVVASSRTAVTDGLVGDATNPRLDDATVEIGDDDFFALNGIGVRLSPQIDGAAAGDGDVFILGAGDLWVWTSPVLQLMYSERQGPATVDLSLFGYVAVKLINAKGLSAIRHT